MSDPSALQVVVVDDVVRFALHVWRYLGRSLGFGIGAVQADEGGRFGRGDEPRAVPTADGRAAVWWIRADETVVRRLEAVERIEAPKLFLIDMKSPHRDYEREIRSWLARRTAKPPEQERIRLVSSYANEGEREVWPKSPATLQWVAEQVREGEDTPTIGAPGCIDVLVTGAGFERRPEAWGSRGRSGEGGGEPRPMRHLGFGLPDTADVLWNMREPFRQEGPGPASSESVVLAWDETDGFPWCCDGAAGERDFQQTMKTLAGDRRLDEWWDLLFESKLRSRLGRGSGLDERRAAKGEARSLEVGMRRAFRDSILRHDWGHLRQALDAARLPWAAWLTTNYTRFADRAIALTLQASRRARTAGGSGTGRFARVPTWRLVSTAQEAQLLIRELQDAGDGNPPLFDRSPLFKLHGDIAHLQTMAIAGHDKDLFSALSVPVDNLYQVYDAAEKFLVLLMRARARENPDVRLRFHVVGHGLRDKALVDVLDRVASARSGEASFRLVGPRRRGESPELAERWKARPVEPVEKDAESYMASLRPHPLSES